MTLSIAEKILEIESGAIAAIWRKPDSRIVDRPDWFQITTASSKQVWANGVHRSKLQAAEAAETAARVLSDYRSRGQRFRWMVGPSATPANLGDILTAAGLTFRGSGLGMIAEIDALDLVLNPRVRVEAVTSANLDDYVRATVMGWNTPEEVGREIHRDMLVRLQAEESLFFLARLDGVPAGAGAVFLHHHSGYLWGSSVLERHRGQGVYRALVAKRLEALRSRHIPLVTIQAKLETAAPICKRIGFEPVCEIAMYVDEAPV